MNIKAFFKKKTRSTESARGRWQGECVKFPLLAANLPEMLTVVYSNERFRI